MPIEIRELIINAVADGGKNKNPAAAAEQSPDPGSGGFDKDALVSECIEKVLEILEMKKER